MKLATRRRIIRLRNRSLRHLQTAAIAGAVVLLGWLLLSHTATFGFRLAAATLR